MKIPTYRAASDRRSRGVDSYLDHFISEFQPTPPEAEDFREALQNVLDELACKLMIEYRERSRLRDKWLFAAWAFSGALAASTILLVVLWK